MKKRRSPFTISLLLHFLPIAAYYIVPLLLFLLSMLLGGKGESDQYPVQEIFTARAGVGDKECKRFYGGIGIKYDLDGMTVTDVAPGYVADRSGIEVGDRIYTDNIRGPIGRTIVIIYSRKGVMYQKTMITEKICLE